VTLGYKLLFGVMIAALIFGCSKVEEPRSKYEGRSESKNLQAADAVGYDVAAIRKNVDNTLNKTDQHNESVDKALNGEEEKK
jgi:hypothetical protein